MVSTSKDFKFTSYSTAMPADSAIGSGAKNGASLMYSQVGSVNVQDFHLKMSKKIAQLTRVIFVLNSKNDEYEDIFEDLKTKHEQQMEKLMLETSDRIDTLQQKLSEQDLLVDRLEALQTQLKKATDERDHLSTELARSSIEQADAEQQKREQYESRIEEMQSQIDLLVTSASKSKSDAEKAHVELDELRRSLTEELTTRYTGEIEQLRAQFAIERQQLFEQQEDLVKRLTNTKAELDEAQKSHAAQLDSTNSAHTEALEKLRALHAMELQAANSATQSDWEQRSKQVEAESQRRVVQLIENEKNLNSRISKMLEEIIEHEQQNETLQKRAVQYEKQLKDREETISALNAQLEQSNTEKQSQLLAVAQAEAMVRESAVSLNKLQIQLTARDSELSALQVQLHEMTERQKATEQAKRSLQEKMGALEEQVDSLQFSRTQNEEAIDRKVRKLQQQIADLAAEKESLIELHEQRLATAERSLRDRESELSLQHEHAINTLKQSFQNERASLQAEQEENSAKLAAENEAALEKLRTEMQALIDQDHAKRQSLEERLLASERALAETQADLERFQSDKSSSSVERTHLLGELEFLRIENNNIREKLDSTETALSELTKRHHTELSRLKEQSEKFGAEQKSVADEAIASLKREVEEQKKSALEAQRKALAQQFDAQRASEREAITAAAEKRHNEQMVSLKSFWESKVAELVQKNSAIESQLESVSNDCERRIRKAENELQLERERYEAHIDEARQQHVISKERIAAEWKKRLEEAEEAHQNTVAALQVDGKAQQKELIEGQLVAHKAAMERLREELIGKAEVERTALEERHAFEIESLKEKFELKHSFEIAELNKSYEVQLAAEKDQTLRCTQLGQQRERSLQQKIEQIQADNERQKQRLADLAASLEDAEKTANTARLELETKQRELARSRSEWNSQIRRAEEDLASKHNHEIRELTDQHKHEIKNMISEFNKAQNLLKERIGQLTADVALWQKRFENREPREADLELIEHLRAALRSREDSLKKQEDEKKFFQNELVNRENNFNKVFNSKLNVGIIDPLTAAKASKKTQLAKKSNSGNRSGSGRSVIEARKTSSNASSIANSRRSSRQLEPLPNSPVHDEKLNRRQPLPTVVR